MVIFRRGFKMTCDQKELRDQFRRYAEAALSGMDHSTMTYENAVGIAFTQATEMMLAEQEYFEQLETKMLESIVKRRRKELGVGVDFRDAPSF